MNSKIVYLDGLRGLAAFIVVVSHFFQVFAPSVFEGNAEIQHFAFESLAARTPLNLLFNGNFSVCLFFVLSGYVLSRRFFQTGDNLIIYSSAIRRYFRLAVPAFISVLFAYLITVFDLGAFDDIRGITRSSMPDPFQADVRLLHMLKESLIHTFFTYGSQYNPVLWTMTYELLGSFLIFAFLLLLRRPGFRFAGYAVLIYGFVDSYYLGFVLGMLLSDLKNGKRDWLACIRRPWVNFILLTAGVYMGSYPYIDPQGTIYSILVWTSVQFHYFEFYHVMGSFLIVSALLNSDRMQSLLSLKVFSYLGKVSFSLYLVHFTIICSFGSYVFLRLNPFVSYGVNVLLTTVITLLLIFVAAHVFHRFIDANTLILLGRWNEWLISTGIRRRRRDSLRLEISMKSDQTKM